MPEIKLDGTWKYQVDEESIGEEQEYFKQKFDKSSWKEVEIPCNWYIGLNLDYNGKVWFYKKIIIDSKWREKDKIVRIFCKGIDYYAKIWVNGYYVGFHEGYFGHFSFNITKFLNFDTVEDNFIMIQVDAPFDEGYPMKKRQFKGGLSHWDCRPGNNSKKRGQERGSGGIWDSVSLKISSELHLKNVKIISDDIENENSAVYIKITGFSKANVEDVNLKIKVSPKNFQGPEQNYLIKNEKINSGRFIIDQEIELKNPQLWWTWDLGEPNVYSIKISINRKEEILDTWNDSFGIRKVDYNKKDGWYLNGYKIFLRGTNFFSNLWLGQMDDEAYTKQIDLVKEANLNFLRLSYHVERSNFYDLIDEAGILIQQDFPTLWGYLTTSETIKAGVKQNIEMVTQLHNRPSIIIFSCMTEPIDEANHQMGRIFKKEVEKNDFLRRIVWSESPADAHPFCGWYYFTKYSYLICPGVPYPSEFGPQSLPNANSPTWNEENLNIKEHWPPDDTWYYHNSQILLTYYNTNITANLGIKEMIRRSQEYQGDNLKFAIETFRRCKGKIHAFAIFTFKDTWPSITWSIVDYYNSPKKSFYDVKNACSPVLCSFSLSENKKSPFPQNELLPVDLNLFLFAEFRGLFWSEDIRPGQNKPVYIHLINDLIEEVDAKLVLKGEYNGSQFFKREIDILIPPSSSKLMYKLNLKLGKSKKSGSIKIISELYRKDDETLLNQNSIELTVQSRLKKIGKLIKRYFSGLRNLAIGLYYGLKLLIS